MINGPNLNLLGLREPELYGREDYQALLAYIEKSAEALGIEVECCQYNGEGEIVTAIQNAYGRADGILINPAAYTHTSIAILDALKAVALPAVEVHLTDIDAREPFRKISYPAMACIKSIKGKGFSGYQEGLEALKAHIDKRK